MNAIAVRASRQKALLADATVGVIVREEPVVPIHRDQWLHQLCRSVLLLHRDIG